MSRLQSPLVAWSLVFAALLGCAPQQPFFIGGDGDLEHYLNVATEIEIPDTDTAPLADAAQTMAPLTLTSPDFKGFWDLSLEECVNIALQNSKVVRVLPQAVGGSGGGVSLANGVGNQFQGGSGGALINAPEAFATIYDPAIAESNPGAQGRPIASASSQGIPGLVQSQQGVEAALAEFDAQFNTSLFWQRTDQPQNRPQNFFIPPVLVQDQMNFVAEISKKSAVGTEFFFRNRTAYTENNTDLTFRPIRSEWLTSFEVEARQPLLRGFGASVNRVPVVLARIRTDIQLTRVEAGVRNLVSDVTRAYWRLYFTYRNLETARVGRDSALGLWKKISALKAQGAQGGSAAQEAQSRGQYYSFRSDMEAALRDLYRSEAQLRYMLGIAATDGRLIRPIDEPQYAKVTFDWQSILHEALARGVELREQKWRVKQREFELIAARNQLLPTLDAVALYRWLGVGDDLMAAGSPQPRFPAADSTALNELALGDYQDWQLGAQMSFPIGYRRELAGVRHYQLLLAREKARLEDMELEISQFLTNAVQDLEASYVLMQTNFNRRAAAEKEVEAYQAIYDAGAGETTLDLLLEAQRRLAVAEIAFYNSVTDYTLAITNVNFRRGALLEQYNIVLAEGPWPQKAYFDAERQARQRDASPKVRYGHTAPDVASQGGLPQHQHGEEIVTPEGVPTDAQPSDPQPEQIPLPNPMPMPGHGTSRRTSTVQPVVYSPSEPEFRQPAGTRLR